MTLLALTSFEQSRGAQFDSSHLQLSLNVSKLGNAETHAECHVTQTDRALARGSNDLLSFMVKFVVPSVRYNYKVGLIP